jgi:predicted ATPase/DNA-binding winged helix-turn-helix (wHTH) protein
MMDSDVAGLKQVAEFGPFRLSTAERLLEKQGAPLSLGSRALDILIMLVGRAGEVVDKRDLISRVWPNITVDDSSLRVHIATLRKTLGDGKSGARYVTNIAGRGYCFVAPISHSVRPNASSIAEPICSDQNHRLPSRLARMIGRDETVNAISDLLAARRFVTIHGPGGIGKTTVAVSVGHAQLAAFQGVIRFIDLGPLYDPDLVPGAIISALGLPVGSKDSTSQLISFLRGRRMLLILDCCEHVIGPVAALAERIYQEAAHISILATSREALRVEGEHVYPLSALESPPEDGGLTASQVLAFPAAHLFVERVAACSHQFELTDLDAPIVAEICRKLDGIALAIELAAGRVGTYGLRETAALLDNRLKLLWHGRRTAVPRHQTLSATVEWSYDLLSEIEREVLRRLSVFIGPFTFEAAAVVAAGDDLGDPMVAEALGLLVAKSLVSVDASGPSTRYRMLDATRAYALAKLIDRGEADSAARRHAIYYRDFLERPLNAGDWSAIVSPYLDNIRKALEWTFSESGNVALGASLAAASAPLFLELSLLTECRHWCEQALSQPGDPLRGTRPEMELQAALGEALMFTAGNSEESNTAMMRGLELAEKFQDQISQFRLTSRLQMYHRRVGDFDRMLQFSRRTEAVAKEIGDPVAIAAAHSLFGTAHHLIGNQAEARTHLEAALVPLPALGARTNQFGFHHLRPRIVLARTLWLLGYPDEAVRNAKLAISEPEPIEPVTLCIVLIWGACVFHWTGDLTTAEECIERVIAHADRHALTPYLAVGLGLKGELLVKRGAVQAGMKLLGSSLATLRTYRYGLYETELKSTLAQCLATSGSFDQALVLIDETIALMESMGDLFMPELLRIKGELLERNMDERGAEEAFMRSIALAGQQSALSWRLRASTNLARLRLRQGSRQQARAALAETYACFSEGFDTADLKAAGQLLSEIAR